MCKEFYSIPIAVGIIIIIIIILVGFLDYEATSHLKSVAQICSILGDFMLAQITAI